MIIQHISDILHKKINKSCELLAGFMQHPEGRVQVYMFDTKYFVQFFQLLSKLCKIIFRKWKHLINYEYYMKQFNLQWELKMSWHLTRSISISILNKYWYKLF